MSEPDTTLSVKYDRSSCSATSDWPAAHRPSHRHDVGARQFPLATTRLTPDDQSVIAETAPGREISQATSACAG